MKFLLKTSLFLSMISVCRAQTQYSISYDANVCGTQYDCTTGVYRNPYFYDGNNINVSAAIQGNLVTFKIRKCDGSAFISNGVFNFRTEDRRCVPANEAWGNLVGGSFQIGDTVLIASALLPADFTTGTRTYYGLLESQSSQPNLHYITDRITISVNAMNTEQIVDNQQVKIFPNPTDGRFTLEFSGENEPQLQVQILNVMGQVMIRQSLDFSSGSVSHLFNVSQLPKGTYFLQIINKQKVFQKSLTL
jgi:Secretion system C-terminal sorting domain